MKHRDPVLKALLSLTVLSLWGVLLRPLLVTAPALAQAQLKPKPAEMPHAALIPAPVGRFTANLETGPCTIVRNLNGEACWYRVRNLGPRELKLSADWNGHAVMLAPNACLDLEIRSDLAVVSDDAAGWYERIH